MSKKIDEQEYGVTLIVDGKVIARDFPVPSQETINVVLKEMIDASRGIEPLNELKAIRFRMWRRMIEWYRLEAERFDAVFGGSSDRRKPL